MVGSGRQRLSHAAETKTNPVATHRISRRAAEALTSCRFSVIRERRAKPYQGD